MNRKILPAVAAFLILVVLLGSTPFTYGQVTAVTFGPNLVVTTIAQGDQVRETGIVVLGLWPFAPSQVHYGSAAGESYNPALNPLPPTCTTDVTTYEANMWDPLTNPSGVQLCGPQNLLSQHKILVTYNGQPLTWRIGDTVQVPAINCNVIEKDKVNVVPDPKTDKGKQFPQENLMTKLSDTSDKWVCKVRWKSPAPGVLESVGVLDVYYVGPFDANWIADYILTVEASVAIGRTVIFGSDIQDICVLGVPFPWIMVGIAKPAFFTTSNPLTTAIGPGSTADNDYEYTVQNSHFVFVTALGPFTSCTDLSLVERQQAGITLDKAQDPLAPS